MVWSSSAYLTSSQQSPSLKFAGNKPNGPSTLTIGRGAPVEVLTFFITGDKTSKLTSGGIDSGARPICDGSCVDAENDREGAKENAGSRNMGKEIEAVDLIAPPTPLIFAAANIAGLYPRQPPSGRAVEAATLFSEVRARIRSKPHLESIALLARNLPR